MQLHLLLEHTWEEKDEVEQILINFECDEVENLSQKKLGALFGTVVRGSTSLFPRYGVYRSLVSNSDMK